MYFNSLWDKRRVHFRECLESKLEGFIVEIVCNFQIHDVKNWISEDDDDLTWTYCLDLY